MALTSDSQTTTNGANVVEHESAGIISGEDLEDGEIFEDEIVETPLAETKPKAEGNVSAETILSNIRNSKPLLPTPKFTVGSDKSSKEKHADPNEKKRRKRQSRDGDDDVEDEKKRRKDNKDKKPHQEQNRKRELQVLEKLEASIANDEDLIFARGASPLRRDDDIDRWEGEDEEDDHRRHAPRSRGLGRRDHSVRGKRRIGRGGSGIARKRKRDDNVCIFYMHGKCHRGSDCPYSHDAYPPRKMELCKFYMMDCCAKKDKCLYMHNEFPCKYYHTGLKCFAGKNCKFSHGKLSETTRTILLKYRSQHLETAPKEILGEFPRMSRDNSMDIGHGRNNKKIPSLFDIKVPKPANLCNNSNSDGNHTPMPSPTHESKNSDREEHISDKEERRARRTKEKVEKRKDKEKRRERRRELRKDREKEKEKNKERSKERRRLSEEEKEKNVVQVIPEKLQEEKEVEIEKESEQEKPTDTNIEPVVAIEENVEAVPAHLPKKQRELFLRIQQQQREANSSQASEEDDEHEEDEPKLEDNWYSSDEDVPPSSSLPSILRNLTQGTNPTSTQTTSTPSLNTSPASVPSSTTSLLPPLISNIDFSKVFQALSSLKKIDQKVEEPLDNNQGLNDESDTKQSSVQDNSAPAPVIDLFSLLKSDTNPTPSSSSALAIPKKIDPPRARDPRLRNDGGGPRNDVSVPRNDGSGDSITPASVTDIDLRLKPSIPRGIGMGDIDLRHLPFKPAPIHSSANEIDASLSSHPPMLYKLIPVEVVKTDYASLQSLAKPGVNDPRLRRIIRTGPEESSSRDPRQRLGLVNDDIRPKIMPTMLVDPRQRNHLLSQAAPSIIPTPSTPRYDEDHRTSFYRSLDSGMRQYPPATPRIDDDYTSNTNRSLDPRQRNLAVGIDADPRRNMYQHPRQYNMDTDLRPQLGMHQSQFNIK